MWTLPSLNFNEYIIANRCVSQKSRTEWQYRNCSDSALISISYASTHFENVSVLFAGLKGLNEKLLLIKYISVKEKKIYHSSKKGNFLTIFFFFTFFLFLHENNMLWVLIRSASLRHF